MFRYFFFGLYSCFCQIYIWIISPFKISNFNRYLPAFRISESTPKLSPFFKSKNDSMIQLKELTQRVDSFTNHVSVLFIPPVRATVRLLTKTWYDSWFLIDSFWDSLPVLLTKVSVVRGYSTYVFILLLVLFPSPFLVLMWH